jgi:thymidylate kinase
MPVHPNFVIFDGLDGSGKTTLARTFTEVLAARGYKVFDVAAHGKKFGDLPLPWMPERDVIFSAEPTHAWVGAAIRRELIRNTTNYTSKIVAEAYSLDRYVLYQRLLLPMLAQGATVVSDRSATTSIIYQPIMDHGVKLDELLELSGNKQALEQAPAHLIITKASAKTCIGRINDRSDKKDDSIFEKEDFLNKAAGRFESTWFRELWEKQGTTVHYVNAELPLETVKAEVAKLADQIFPVA